MAKNSHNPTTKPRINSYVEFIYLGIRRAGSVSSAAPAGGVGFLIFFKENGDNSWIHSELVEIIIVV